MNANIKVKVVLMFDSERLSTSDTSIPSPKRAWFAYDPESAEKALEFLKANLFAKVVTIDPIDQEHSDEYGDGENSLSDEEVRISRMGIDFQCQDESGSDFYYKYCYPSLMFDWETNGEGLVDLPDVIITTGVQSLIVWYTDVNDLEPESVMKLNVSGNDFSGPFVTDKACINSLNSLAALSNLKDKQFTLASPGKFEFDGKQYEFKSVRSCEGAFEFFLAK